MNRFRQRGRHWLIGIAALAACAEAGAHDARPLSIAILEQASGVYRTVVRVPPTVDTSNTPELTWPDQCEIRESAGLATGTGLVSLIACPGGLEGREIRIAYPGYNPSITTLYRLQPLDGSARTAVLPPDELAWTVPGEPGPLQIARDYTELGFEHIWEGPDHLLFVAGLLLLAASPRRILLAVTGFTAAHSITLTLATLGVVRVPITPVEALIALSIVFVAVEIANRDRSSFSHRYPVALAFVFGLLHGFGFASALSEIGLPTNELAMGLLFFNVGVELGQVAFIAAAGAGLLGLRLLSRFVSAGTRSRWSRQAIAVGAYAIGIPAALWFFERSAAVLLG